jgi:hypothetical protein
MKKIEKFMKKQFLLSTVRLHQWGYSCKSNDNAKGQLFFASWRTRRCSHDLGEDTREMTLVGRSTVAATEASEIYRFVIR